MGHPTGHDAAYLIVGDDPALRAHAVANVLDRVCGPERMELTEVGPGTDLTMLLLGTPFFTAYQVVLFRDKQLDPVVVLSLMLTLKNGNPTTILVISAETVPAELTKIVKAAGGVVTDTTSRRAADTVRELLEQAPFTVDSTTRQMIIQHVGEDPSLVLGLITTLTATYGPGVRLTAEQVVPYLSVPGGVPPWALTDAIDDRDPAAALRALQRMLAERDPMVVLAILTGHVDRLHQLANLGETDEKRAAATLGVKGSTYPTKKALQKLPRWGDPAAALVLIAAAGEALRGGSAVPRPALMQVLVGRLALR